MEISTLYWLLTLSKLSEISDDMTLVATILVIIAFFGWIMNGEKHNRFTTASIIVGVILLILSPILYVFVPSRQDMLIIFGVHEVTTNETVTETTQKLFEYINSELQTLINENTE